jgi:hypothetical protein
LNDLSSIFDILRSDDRHSSLVRFLQQATQERDQERQRERQGP